MKNPIDTVLMPSSDSAPTLSKDVVGKQLKKFSFKIEPVKVREFLLATGEDSPLYHDDAVAQKAGHPRTPIPPTFQTSAIFWGYPEFWSDMTSIGVDIKHLLHLKEEYTYHKTVYTEDVLDCEVSVADVRTGRMNMVTFSTKFSRSDELCIEARMTIVIAPPQEKSNG